MNDAKFVRDGSLYNAKTAATFLRLKWEANNAEVRTARDFSDKIATVSGTSGKPYLIPLQGWQRGQQPRRLIDGVGQTRKPG
jgi:hypothetical protein